MKQTDTRGAQESIWLLIALLLAFILLAGYLFWKKLPPHMEYEPVNVVLSLVA